MHKIVLLCLMVSVVGAQETRLSNLEQLQALGQQLLKDSLAIHPGKTDSAALILQANHEMSTKNWFVENMLVKWAREKGFEKIVRGDRETDRTLVYRLEYQPIALKVRYLDHSESFVNRHCSLAFYALLTDPGDAVLFSGTLADSVVDRVPKDAVNELENAELEFTIGTRATTASWLSKSFEPFLVSSVTGIVIYLFYSFRSR